MPAGIESMYDGHLAEDVVILATTERVLRYNFKTKDEMEGFIIKLDREPRRTREGTVTYKVLQADFEEKALLLSMTAVRSFGDGISPDLVYSEHAIELTKLI